MDFSSSTHILAEAAGRALGGIIGKFRRFKNIGFATYSKLYETCVVPIADYGSNVWGFKTLRMQKLSISELSDTFLVYTHLLRDEGNVR